MTGHLRPLKSILSVHQTNHGKEFLLVVVVSDPTDPRMEIDLDLLDIVAFSVSYVIKSHFSS